MVYALNDMSLSIGFTVGPILGSVVQGSLPGNGTSYVFIVDVVIVVILIVVVAAYGGYFQVFVALSDVIYL